MFLFFWLYHLMLSGNFYCSEIRHGIFLGFDICPHSIIPVTLNPEYTPIVGRADKGYHLSALVVGFHATSYSFGIRLTAKTVDEDPASYKRWISKKRSNHQKY